MAATRILVVEDDSAIRRELWMLCAFKGMWYPRLRMERSVCHALEPRYDMLLLDLILPGKQGLEILKEVRLAYPTLRLSLSLPREMKRPCEWFETRR